MKTEGEKKKKKVSLQVHGPMLWEQGAAGHVGKDHACPQAPGAGFFGFLPAALSGYSARVCPVGTTSPLRSPVAAGTA